MLTTSARRSRLPILLWTLLLAALAVAVPGRVEAAKFYVDNRHGELDPGQKATVANPRPVQLLFAFQTDGQPNVRATNEVKNQVIEIIRASGVFSEISSTPVADGAVLNITFNNIPQRDAARRGFMAGLTLGLAGTMVTDNYHVTFEFLPAGNGAPVTRTIDHALHVTVGRTDPPPNADPVRNAREAVATMVRQSIAHGMNALAGDPVFSPAAAEAPAVATTADAPDTATEPASAAESEPAIPSGRR